MTVWTSSPTIGHRIELLEDFATQRLGVRFAVVDLAAGKFPVTGQVRALGPQRQQERSSRSITAATTTIGVIARRP